MSKRVHDSQRWLRLALALLVLLLDTGVHGWLHRRSRVPGHDTQQAELHTQLELVAGYDADCMICKAGGVHVALVPNTRVADHERPRVHVATTSMGDTVRASIIPGVLGARAPPVTNG